MLLFYFGKAFTVERGGGMNVKKNMYPCPNGDNLQGRDDRGIIFFQHPPIKQQVKKYCFEWVW
jgi:hypothetical protein